MNAIGAVAADTAQMGLRYFKRLATGIEEGRAGRFGKVGVQTIQANHPKFIAGHLCLYPAKVFELLEQDKTSLAIPESYEGLFSKLATCQDDVTGELYPAFAELAGNLERSYLAAFAVLRSATDEQLLAPNPMDTPMKDVLPTLGALLSFYMNGHVSSHLGQLSTWRRIEGLPAA